MPKQITFTSKTEASEYAKAMKGKGWDVLLTHDEKSNTWIVYVSLVKEGKAMTESKVPTTLTGILSKIEEEAGAETIWPRRQLRRLGKGAKRTGTEIVREGDIAVMEVASGRAATPILQRTSRRIDVVGGMKKAIPVPGGAGHGYLARIGEMKAAEIAELPRRGEGSIAEIGKPNIVKVVRAPIATTGSGVASETPKGMRFQIDTRKVRFKLPSVNEKGEIEE